MNYNNNVERKRIFPLFKNYYYIIIHDTDDIQYNA